MLIKDLHGTILHSLDEIGRTKEIIVEKYNEALPHQNVSFTFDGITIETCDEGNHIKICKQDSEQYWSYDVIHSALKFKTLDDFVDLVLNYSEDKVKNEYINDSVHLVKQYIDALGVDEKDKLLLALLKDKMKS